MIARMMNMVSKVFFGTVVVLFCLFAVGLVVASLWQVLEAASSAAGVLDAMLRGVGLVTIALAVFEVGKFLAEEELMRERELGSVREARYSLTKFMTLIIIVISIEAIVLVFEAKTESTDRILYPTLLLLVGVIAVVALGVFQRLVRNADSQGEWQPRKRPGGQAAGEGRRPNDDDGAPGP